ncbi:MAG TPA: hypothetical protein PLN25_02205 [Deltaproteobacteria bacterium]|nr:hypothetical protein [Deltaproteobacteria bacterium]HQB39690.1 hypothetical protein [Deltaproteobacteria bacterium]
MSSTGTDNVELLLTDIVRIIAENRLFLKKLAGDDADLELEDAGVAEDREGEDEFEEL